MHAGLRLDGWKKSDFVPKMRGSMKRFWNCPAIVLSALIPGFAWAADASNLPYQDCLIATAVGDEVIPAPVVYRFTTMRSPSANYPVGSILVGGAPFAPPQTGQA